MTDTDRIQGAWVPTKAVFSGESAPDLVLQKSETVFASGEYRMYFGGKVSARGKFTLAENSEPKGLVLHGTAGPVDGRTLHAIYQLVRDRLRICFTTDGGRRPAEFASPAGSPHYLVTYRRKDSIG